ncbi:hypothetical protein LXL04_008868 [Taraxacum kok-saghyz]
MYGLWLHNISFGLNFSFFGILFLSFSRIGLFWSFFGPLLYAPLFHIFFSYVQRNKIEIIIRIFICGYCFSPFLVRFSLLPHFNGMNVFNVRVYVNPGGLPRDHFNRNWWMIGWKIVVVYLVFFEI